MSEADNTEVVRLALHGGCYLCGGQRCGDLNPLETRLVSEIRWVKEKRMDEDDRMFAWEIENLLRLRGHA